MIKKESTKNYTGGGSIDICQGLKHRIKRKVNSRQYKGTSPSFDSGTLNEEASSREHR